MTTEAPPGLLERLLQFEADDSLLTRLQDPETGLLDYDAVAAKAREFKPLVLVAGYSAYPRRVDFARMREIADSVGAKLLFDAAHLSGMVAGKAPKKTLRQAVTQIIIADVSMSLDNVLAVAGAARDHPGILIVGLIFAVALMGLAANVIAKYIERYRWIAYIGLAVIVYVSVKMIYDGWVDPAVGLGRLFA